MKVIFEKIDDLSNNKVEFYTVRLGGNAFSEFELFDEKDFPNHVEELQILYSVINQIQFRGAKHFFFKQEGPANALPRVNQVIIDANKEDLGIRLYCIRLTDYVLVLLNGDIKITNNPKDCPNVKPHFENALKIAKKLDALLMDKEIDYKQYDCLVNFETEI